MMPDRHYVSHGRYWGGGTNRMPLCYKGTLRVVVAMPGVTPEIFLVDYSAQLLTRGGGKTFTQGVSVSACH